MTVDFSPLTVLVGPNGSGKNGGLEALRKVSDLRSQRNHGETRFPTESRTNWDTRSEQLFELDIRLPAEVPGDAPLPAGWYRYSLRVKHDRRREKNRIAEERLVCAGRGLERGWLDASAAGALETPPSARIFSGTMAPKGPKFWAIGTIRAAAGLGPVRKTCCASVSAGRLTI